MDRMDLVGASSSAASRLSFHEIQPDRAATSQMTAFTRALERHTGRSFADYQALHDFSVRDYRTFWSFLLRWSEDIDWSGSAEPACIGDECEHARFFPHVRLNYADALLNLAVAPAHMPALTVCHANGPTLHLTRGELRERVARLADALSALGLGEGDRVIGVLRNDADAVVTALAVTALGATLSTVAPEMSAETMLERFQPLEPRFMFAHTAAQPFDIGVPVEANVAVLAAALPSLQHIVVLDGGSLPDRVKPNVHAMADLIANGDAARFAWRQFPFNEPLFIMFSSGTTGKPKCIVHGAGGTLLQHLKEHRLHSDLRPGERLFFHTSCAWMMWNWQLSALASGVEIVTYDGPISTVDTLWRLVADERATVFGTSPAYLKMSEEAGLVPGKQFDLGALRAMLSTGAVLYDAQFAWVRDHVKPLPLQSISGGTDILGCFVLGNPTLPVYAGEAQCRSLGLDVQAWEQGKRTDGVGQLVCANPFPSRPLGFFGDTDGARFHAAYFADNPGVWTHGDLIEVSREGSVRLHGRSDGLLNVRGINVGPGEIYRILNDIPEIHESMVVQQHARVAPRDGSSAVASEPRVVLLLVLRDGCVLNGALAARVRHDLARRASPAHVPDRILAVAELPVTHNGKLSEASVRNAVNGLPAGNAAALRNPACLDAIRHHPALHLATREIPPPGETLESLEKHVQAHWERLFEFAPIGRDDNFFELGGHSLLAARMLAEIHQTTGRAMPLATLMIAPTIARLAAAIDESARQPASSPILLQVRAGEGTPIFLAHSVSGSVMECLTLVNALHSRRPVYGLQAHGLDGEQPMHRRVEDMAASYVEQMRRVQPSGPYAIAGFSFGGLVAFEIAQQLSRAGERIELLCLLDTYVHEHFLPLHVRLRHHWRMAGGQLRELRAVPAARLPGYLAGKLVHATDRIRRRTGRSARRPDPFIASLPPTLRRIRETMGTAMRTYRPRPYEAGPILYLRAAIAERERGDPMPLWRSIARGGLVVAEVSGGHGDMIVEPNVQRAAAVLDERLASA
ncbi:UNVERIFIED_ORG: acetoacetyl-CoA synthetase [Burkholderia sp. 1595]|uniref:Acetoacetyl-CoA synthetase n=1 Tax=Paraburkholderia terricola TaxID=169427 RepID=A0ABU1M246_9BURK|nr:acetoacetyl-CoA synthetase [Paraburkholderia terricola]